MNIVILGGGTAGWLSALMIKKTQPYHKVTVIESSKIGIVGVGEGSTGLLPDIIQGNYWDFGCDEQDFFIKTKSTLKLGIQHKDWKRIGHEYIGPIDSPIYYDFGTDYRLMNAIANDIPFHTASFNGFLSERNKSTFYFEDNYLNSFGRHAYHFDTNLVGKYFKDICGDSVIHIDSIINDCIVNSDGDVEYIILDDGTKIFGDFFIDASGLSRILSKKMDCEWVSYSDRLPLDRAISFNLDLDEEVRPLTVAHAQKNGWIWKIPTQERFGAGYVYSSSFVSDDEAKDEAEKSIGHELDIIKNIKFSPGRQKNLWKNNCLFVGLAAAFSEPLEATSIHTTIVQLHTFIFQYLRDTKEETCNVGASKIYNKRMSMLYDDFADFINLHYATQRNDSEFWKEVSSDKFKTENVKRYIELSKTRPMIDGDINSYWGYIGSTLYNYILSGLGYIDKENAKKQLNFFGQEQVAMKDRYEFVSEMNEISSKTISHKDFIKMIIRHRENNA